MLDPRVRLSLTIACLVLAFGACAQRETPPPPPEPAPESSAEAPDAVAAAPDVYAVLYEDERVRVLDMNLPAGATDGLHRHPHEVAYFLQGGSLEVALPSGEVLAVELPDGAVLSHAPWVHTVTNVGSTDAHAIVVEMQQEPGGQAAVAAGHDAVSAAPDYYSVLNEDETARVLDMHLPAGHTDGEHTHPAELAYFITGGTVRITTADGSMEAEIPDGHVLSHEGWTHSVENIGDTDVHAIVWELR